MHNRPTPPSVIETAAFYVVALAAFLALSIGGAILGAKLIALVLTGSAC